MLRKSYVYAQWYKYEHLGCSYRTSNSSIRHFKEFCESRNKIGVNLLKPASAEVPSPQGFQGEGRGPETGSKVGDLGRRLGKIAIGSVFVLSEIQSEWPSELKVQSEAQADCQLRLRRAAWVKACGFFAQCEIEAARPSNSQVQSEAQAGYKVRLRWAA